MLWLRQWSPVCIAPRWNWRWFVAVPARWLIAPFLSFSLCFFSLTSSSFYSVPPLSLSLSLFLSPLLVLLLLSSCSSSSDWREPLPVAYGSLSFFIVFFFHEPAGNRCRVPERAVVDAVKSATCAWPVALLRFRARWKVALVIVHDCNWCSRQFIDTYFIFHGQPVCTSRGYIPLAPLLRPRRNSRI